MAFVQGIYFRATDNQVSPANYAVETGTTANYPRTPAFGDAVAVGWEQAIGSTPRDRVTTGPVELRGIAVASSSAPAPCNYRIDLPASGDHNIRSAFGDASFSAAGMRAEFYDGTTLFSTPVPDGSKTTAGGQFYDATGVNRTSATDWATNNAPLANAFSSQIFRVRLYGPSSPTSRNTPIAALYIEAAAGGGTISGDLSVTFASMTLAGAGTLGPITAQAAVTFSGMTLSAAGVLPIAGQAAVTFAPMTLAGEGALGAISGEAAITFADMSLQASGGDPNAEAAAFDVLLRARRRGVR